MLKVLDKDIYSFLFQQLHPSNDRQRQFEHTNQDIYFHSTGL